MPWHTLRSAPPWNRTARLPLGLVASSPGRRLRPPNPSPLLGSRISPRQQAGAGQLRVPLPRPRQGAGVPIRTLARAAPSPSPTPHLRSFDPSPLIRRPGAAAPGQTATGWASPALLPLTGGLRPSPLMPLVFFFLSAHLLDATVGSGRQATTVFPDAILDVQPRTAGALACG